MRAIESFPELQESGSILDNKYKVIHTIGQGRYAKVKIAIGIENNKRYAIKIMNEKSINSEKQLQNFIKEVQIMQKLDNENIIKLIEIKIDGTLQKSDGRTINAIYYVMKLAEMGELFNIINLTQAFSENLARYIFRQLLTGIQYLHQNNIAHRDIKTENILISNSSNQIQVKICDFGFSTEYINDQHQKIQFDNKEPVGSPEYNAPEIANKNIHSNYYADQMDLYSAGIVLFMMVMKSAPFLTTNLSDPYFQRFILKDKQCFWQIFSQQVQPSEQFKDLIENMLNEHPNKRFNIEQIKSHPWYLGQIPTQEELISDMKEREDIIIQQQKELLQRKNFKKQRKMNTADKTNLKSREHKVNIEVRKKYVDLANKINNQIRLVKFQKIQKKKQSQQQIKGEESLKKEHFFQVIQHDQQSPQASFLPQKMQQQQYSEISQQNKYKQKVKQDVCPNILDLNEKMQKFNLVDDLSADNEKYKQEEYKHSPKSNNSLLKCKQAKRKSTELQQKTIEEIQKPNRSQRQVNSDSDQEE